MRQVFSVQHKNKNNAFTFGGGWNRYKGHHFGDVIWAFRSFPDHYRWYDHDALKTDNNFYAKYERTLKPGLQAFGDLLRSNIRAEDIEPAPAFGTRIRRDFIAGMGKVRGRFVILLDVARVLAVGVPAEALAAVS